MEQQELQSLLKQYQEYQQQYQALVLQKENLKLQMLEVDNALDELERTQEKEGYKIVGSIMIKKPVEKLKEELRDRRINLDLRIKTIEKTESRIVEKLKELEEKIKPLLG